jgi:DNA-directed RNA polymerase specialized sigma24 family protein
MLCLTPDEFAERLIELRPTLLTYAARTRPCQEEDAEDLVSDAVYRALLLLELFDAATGPAGFQRWMTGIVKIAVLRDRETARTRIETVPIAHALQIPSEPAHPLRCAIQPHLDALPKKLFVVVSDHLAGYTQGEIANRWGLHRNSVASRMEQAEQLLKLSFPDFEGEWEMDFFDWCAKQFCSYKKPGGMSRRWTGHHPPDRCLTGRRVAK